MKSQTTINLLSQTTDMEKITVKTLAGTCKRHFRMNKNDRSSRRSIYEALERQPQHIQDLVKADILDMISRGIVRYTRVKRTNIEVYADETGVQQHPKRRRINNDPENLNEVIASRAESDADTSMETDGKYI